MTTLSAGSTIRILLVDDHEVVRCGLRMILESHAGLAVVSETTTVAATLEAARREAPDIILLDLDLGDESGLDAIPALRSTAPAARIIVLTGKREPDLHRQAVHAGAAGLVLKDHSTQTLVQAIEHVHAGRAWLDASLIATVVTEVARARAEDDPEALKMASLTERERQVIGLICEGLQNKLIADRLSISETTVRHHLTSVFNKLALDSRLELVIYAYRQGLAHLPERSLLQQSVAR